MQYCPSGLKTSATPNAPSDRREATKLFSTTQSQEQVRVVAYPCATSTAHHKNKMRMNRGTVYSETSGQTPSAQITECTTHTSQVGTEHV